MSRKLFVVIGNSGSGKTSTMRALLGSNREIVSVTTRAPREGEVDGVDYYFITPEEYDELDKRGSLIEKVEYDGNKYGVTSEEVESKLSSGYAYIIVEHNGYEQLKKLYEDIVVSIFIFNTKDEARWAMMDRGDSRVKLEKRLSTYEKELSHYDKYDYIVYNKYGDPGIARSIISKIIRNHIGFAKYCMLIFRSIWEVLFK